MVSRPECKQWRRVVRSEVNFEIARVDARGYKSRECWNAGMNVFEIVVGLGVDMWGRSVMTVVAGVLQRQRC